jgi:hypothetical protein
MLSVTAKPAASTLDELMGMEDWWNDTDRGKVGAGRKFCPSATSSTTNPLGNGLESN